MKRQLKIFTGLVAIAALAAVISACSGSGGSGGGTSNITISGAIATTTAFVAANKNGDVHQSNENGMMNVNLGDLEIYVIYFNAGAVGVVQASVDSTTGQWSFQVPPGSQINAIVRNKVSAELVGPITFVDATQKDMSGNNKESSTFSFTKGAGVGTIVLSDDGKFKVDATQPAVAGASNVTNAAPTSTVNFSGSWTLAAFDGTIPSGYQTACAPGNMTCHGPVSGEPVYLVKLAGKKFSYTGGNCAARTTDKTTACTSGDGTVGTQDQHAAQIWGGGAAIEACGFKVGFSADDARAFGRVHILPGDLPVITGAGVITPSAMTFGRVTFAVPAGYGTNGGDAGPNNLPWMKGSATTTYDIMDCKNVEKTGTDGKKYNLNVCKGTLSNTAQGYQANGPGGCVDMSSGSPVPVIVKNWAGLNGLTPNCGSGPSNHPALANMKFQSCAYTAVSNTIASAANFSCTNTWGTFTDANATAPAAGGVYMQTFAKVNAGSTCSSIGDQLTRYRCYANAYWQDPNHNGSGCTTELRFNWNATNAADFVAVDGSRDNPKDQYLTSIVNYSPDGKSFTLEDNENEGVSVQAGTSSVVCRVTRKTILKATELTATKLLVDLTESSYLTDTQNALCVGEKNNSSANGGNGTDLHRRVKEGNGKFIFYLTK